VDEPVMLELGVDGELVDQMEEISPDGPEYEELKACLLAKFPDDQICC